MKYLALIYSEEQDPSTVDPKEMEEVMAAYNRFTKDLQDSGVYTGGEALQPTSTATTVRVRDGKTMTTDGPFAETREALGGYYILECKDLDEAIEWAAKLPGSWHGSVEIRPIMECAQHKIEANGVSDRADGVQSHRRIALLHPPLGRPGDTGPLGDLLTWHGERCPSDFHLLTKATGLVMRSAGPGSRAPSSMSHGYHHGQRCMSADHRPLIEWLRGGRVLAM